jgi:hypothetical protein
MENATAPIAASDTPIMLCVPDRLAVGALGQGVAGAAGCEVASVSLSEISAMVRLTISVGDRMMSPAGERQLLFGKAPFAFDEGSCRPPRRGLDGHS